LKVLLKTEKNFQIVGEASTGEEAISKVQILKPDLVVMDLGLPGIGGLEASRVIIQENPEIKIVVLSMHIKHDFVSKAIEVGCSAFVPKSSTHESLVEAIYTVLSGENYLHPKAASALFESMSDDTDIDRQYNKLTPREQQVLKLAAMGFTSQEIGEKLTLSPNTVDTYRHRAFQKLEIKNRAELVKFAVRAGLLDGLKGS
jgi:DNA-binding NarL/FixJ family response regulator